MRLSNELVYGGALKCASESVATGRLNYPNMDVLQKVSEKITNVGFSRYIFKNGNLCICEDKER